MGRRKGKIRHNDKKACGRTNVDIAEMSKILKNAGIELPPRKVRSFVETEALLCLVYELEPDADPRDANYALDGYVLMGMSDVDCTQDMARLRSMSLRLPEFKSGTAWREALMDYMAPELASVRAWDVLGDLSDYNAKCGIVPADAGYEMPFDDRRRLLWAPFWDCTVTGGSAKFADVKAGTAYAYNIQTSKSKLLRGPVEFDTDGSVRGYTVVQAGPRPVIVVPLDELLDAADEMDRLGDTCGVKAVMGSMGLIEVDEDGNHGPGCELDICGEVNLLGMVGAGKTSLIRVLAYWFATRYSPSVWQATGRRPKLVIVRYMVSEALEMAEYLDDLIAKSGAQGCRVVPLCGSGTESRGRVLSQSSGAMDAAYPTEYASRWLFGACRLEAAVGSDASEPMAFGQEPCWSLRCDGKDHVCGHFDTCPRTQMYRESCDADVVVTTMAGLRSIRVSAGRVPFFDIALHEADLVVFDESDLAQEQFDAGFCPSASIGSWISSLESEIARAMRDNKQMDSRNVEGSALRMEWDRLCMDSRVWKNRIMSACFGWGFGKKGPGKWDVVAPGNMFWSVSLINSLVQDGVGDDQCGYKLQRDFGDMLASLRGNRLFGDPLLGFLFRSIRDDCCDWNPRGKSEFDSLYDTWIASACPDVANCPVQLRPYLDRRIKFVLMMVGFDRHLSALRAKYLERLGDGSFNGLDAHKLLGDGYDACMDRLPSSLIGNVFGFQVTQAGDDLNIVRQLAVGRSLMKDLTYLALDADGRSAGPNVLMLSGSSWMPGSWKDHVTRPVGYVLESDPAKLGFLSRAVFYPPLDPDTRVSGSKDGTRREAMLDRLVEAYADAILNEIERGRSNGIDGKVLLVVNSYKEALSAARKLTDVLWARLHGVRKDMDFTVGALCRAGDIVGRKPRPGDMCRYLSRSDIELFGQDDLMKVLVAPAKAISRGHNIVDGTGHAAIIAEFLMVRPMGHPDDIADATGRLNGYIDAAVRDMDGRDRPVSFSKQVRRMAWRQWDRVNQSMFRGLDSVLDDDIRTDIVLDVWACIEQVYGRMARVSSTSRPEPHVYFCDGAFVAPTGSKQGFDFLAELWRWLEARMDPADPDSWLAEALYGPFYQAMKDMRFVDDPDDDEDGIVAQDDAFYADEADGFMGEE